jgi:hypothetical protein
MEIVTGKSVFGTLAVTYQSHLITIEKHSPGSDYFGFFSPVFFREMKIIFMPQNAFGKEHQEKNNQNYTENKVWKY